MTVSNSDSKYKDEYRWDFLVDGKRKRIWETELDMLRLLDKLCKENNLKYFAEFGTLLGAVRHKGFIPWDDDIDVVMMRDDYNKLLEIAPDYFSYPYFFQNVYTNPQVIWSFSKIRDDRTSLVEFPHLGKEFHQGIFLDIFPFDDVPDGINYSFDQFRIIMEIWRCCTEPANLINDISSDKKIVMNPDLIRTIISLPIQERFRVFENSLTDMYGKTEMCNFFGHLGHRADHKKSWYNEIIYLPFEDFEIPVPKEYETILTFEFGDYMKPVMGGTAHETAIIDPDRPYTDYLE